QSCFASSNRARRLSFLTRYSPFICLTSSSLSLCTSRRRAPSLAACSRDRPSAVYSARLFVAEPRRPFSSMTDAPPGRMTKAKAAAERLGLAGWHPREIQACFVGTGPGSYTGLRVGIMAAKAFAYATGCALLGADTFATIAGQAPAEALRLDVIADAQQDRVY